MAMIEERYFDAAASCGRALAAVLAGALESALRRRGRAALVVTGGTEPRHVYPHLAGAEINWGGVSVTLTDERWVAADHADSNEKLVRGFLLQGPAAAAEFVGLKTPFDTPERGLDECAARLGDFPWPADAVYLGMGTDGHIASLFPGSAACEAGGHCVAAAGPAGSAARMSLSPAAILSARRIFLMAAGPEKRDVLNAAKAPGPVAECPVRLILHQDLAPVTAFLARNR